MNNIYILANKVAQFLSSYNAEVQYVPEFELKNSKTMRVLVVPAGTDYKSVARNLHSEQPCIHIGIAKKVINEDVSELIDLVQNIAQSFINRHFDDAVCVQVAFDPLYSPTHLREKALFVSVIELTFTVTR